MNIGTAIKISREARNMTQAQMATAADTNQPQIARWESAGSLPFNSIKRAAAALGMRAVDLVKLTQEPDPAPPVCALCGSKIAPGKGQHIFQNRGHFTDSGPVFCPDCIMYRTNEAVALVRQSTDD